MLQQGYMAASELYLSGGNVLTVYTAGTGLYGFYEGYTAKDPVIPDFGSGHYLLAPYETGQMLGYGSARIADGFNEVLK